MNSTTTNDCSTTEVSVVPPENGSARCQYRFSNGKRCQLPGLESQSGFCSRHFRPLAVSFPSSANDSQDLSADLLPELNEFSSGEDVQKFLARLGRSSHQGPRLAPPCSATSPTNSSILIAPWTWNPKMSPSNSSSTSRAPSATREWPAMTAHESQITSHGMECQTFRLKGGTYFSSSMTRAR